MRRVSGAEILTVTATWPCRTCGEAQVAIAGFEPPADGLCSDCRERIAAQTLTPHVERAEIPRLFRPYAIAGRAAWSVQFRRPWPRALADVGKLSVAYLWGPTGTGKTTAAAILLVEQLAAGRAGLWVDGIEIRAAVKRSFNGGAGGDLERALAAPVIVYDEPLAGEPTPWDLSEVAYRIVRTREAEGRLTIVTSQLDPAELYPAVGAKPTFPPPLVSRLLSGATVWLGEDDARLRVGEGA